MTSSPIYLPSNEQPDILTSHNEPPYSPLPIPTRPSGPTVNGSTPIHGGIGVEPWSAVDHVSHEIDSPTYDFLCPNAETNVQSADGSDLIDESGVVDVEWNNVSDIKDSHITVSSVGHSADMASQRPGPGSRYQTNGGTAPAPPAHQTPSRHFGCSKITDGGATGSEYGKSQLTTIDYSAPAAAVTAEELLAERTVPSSSILDSAAEQTTRKVQGAVFV